MFQDRQKADSKSESPPQMKTTRTADVQMLNGLVALSQSKLSSIQSHTTFETATALLFVYLMQRAKHDDGVNDGGVGMAGLKQQRVPELRRKIARHLERGSLAEEVERSTFLGISVEAGT